MANHNRHRKIFVAVLLFALLVLSNTLCFIQAVAGDRNHNPYQVLGVTRSAAQKEIEKSYKSLCLKFHPDKNVNRPQKEREQCENKFKEIQHAYSLIGNEKSRRSYEMQEAYGIPRSSSSSSSSYASSRPSSFGGSDPLADAFFRAFQQSGPSMYFAKGPDGRPRFGVRRAFPTGPAEYAMPGNLSFKSIYHQKVKVPLEQLYTGADFEFKLVDNIWTRWRAAIRGKIIYLSLYQGLIYSMPMIRTSRVLAAIVGMFIVHATLPKPDPLQSYLSTLPRGSKGNGTKVRFQQTRNSLPEVVFELQEAPHRRYSRVDNDLHTFVRIKKREAELGCTKRIPNLDPSQDPISIEVPPQAAHGDTIRIRGKGWPIRNANIHGDLLVKVEIQEQGGKKQRGKRRKN